MPDSKFFRVSWHITYEDKDGKLITEYFKPRHITDLFRDRKALLTEIYDEVTTRFGDTVENKKSFLID